MSILYRVTDFIRRQPLGTILGLVLFWVLLAAVNYLLIRAPGIDPHTPAHFPIGVFLGPTLHLSGIPYIALFLALLFFSSRYAGSLKEYQVLLIGISVIVLGNLGQGGIDAAFLRPFYETGIQYYHDAVKIDSWTKWLSGFNENQTLLLNHTRTHPPFAVLIHHFFLRISGGSITFLSFMFLLLSALSLPLLQSVLRIMGITHERRNSLILLYSVIPAVNIYTAVSLDGLVLTASSLFLLGLVTVLEKPGALVPGTILMALGLVAANMLTFGGSFLIAVAGVTAIREIFRRKKFTVSFATIASLVALLLSLLLLERGFGYNHLQSLSTASRLENPDGFRGFAGSVAYLMTRIEGVCEIALFFSLGCLATILHCRRRRSPSFQGRGEWDAMAWVGVLSLLAMFMAGAFKTGETARVCLFIYPYLVIFLRGVDRIALGDLILIAGFQTAAMQLLGGYFW